MRRPARERPPAGYGAGPARLLLAADTTPSVARGLNDLAVAADTA